MTLHNLRTTITPAEFAELQSLANQSDSDLAKRWVAAVAEELYQEWAKLEDGSHLKEAYRDEVWTWSDRDLAEAPEADPEEFVRFVRPVHP